jgi:hypothetical protein
LFPGIEMSEVAIHKNGHKLETDANVHVDILDKVIILRVDNVSVDNEALYTVSVQGSQKDHGEVNLTVITAASAKEKER